MSIEILYAGLLSEPLSAGTAAAAVDAPDCGAVVTFAGVVRNHDGGRDVSSLAYSGHPSAGRVMAEVAAGVAARHGNDGGTARIWVAHRLGALSVGDPALVCAVAAPHRGLAFALCSELVDAVKAGVPIWKEQFFADGSAEWVGADGRPATGR